MSAAAAIWALVKLTFIRKPEACGQVSFKPFQPALRSQPLFGAPQS
jgi:hypothetical protein